MVEDIEEEGVDRGEITEEVVIEDVVEGVVVVDGVEEEVLERLHGPNAIAKAVHVNPHITRVRRGQTALYTVVRGPASRKLVV